MHEPNSSLGSPRLEVSLYDNFEPSYIARPNLDEDISLHRLDQECDIPLSYHLTFQPTLAHLSMSLMMS